VVGRHFAGEGYRGDAAGGVHYDDLAAVDSRIDTARLTGIHLARAAA
jgi:hypothetical protein